MVEVVGTAPTSAMVITKFVYRRSWKTNIINIKGITTDSITIMKLTKEQAEEIKNQQSQSNQTKRVTVPELENILYEAIPALAQKEMLLGSPPCSPHIPSLIFLFWLLPFATAISTKSETPSSIDTKGSIENILFSK